MVQTVLEQPSPCLNERHRESAHRILDQLFDEVDGRRGWYGEVGIRMSVANGQLQAHVKTVQEQNHKF